MNMESSLPDIRQHVESIPERIRQVKGNQTTTAFARFLGVGVSTLHNYENGRVPPIEFLLLLSKKCGVSLTWLVTGEGSPKDSGSGADQGCTGRVLVVDDQDYQRQSICNILEADGYQVYQAPNVSGALTELEAHPCDVVVTDLRMPDEDDGLRLLKNLQERSPETQTIIVTVHEATARAAVEAIREGAVDYLVMSPRFPEELSAAVRKAFQNLRSPAGAGESQPGDGIDSISRDPAMKAALETARQAVQSPGLPVLIEGEPGAGKEYLARAIHLSDPLRHGNPFVPVRCSAFQEEELYVELFGRPRRGQLGAGSAIPGAFEQVRGGTIYLADIDATSSRFQVDLLAWIENGEVSLPGGEPIRSENVRVICGTQRSPVELVAEGRLRQDLFFRLQVLHIAVRPLRDRPRDVESLARYFAAEFCRDSSRDTPDIHPDVVPLLHKARWKENVRELRTVIERALVSSSGPVLSESHLLEALNRTGAYSGEPTQ